MAQQTINIGTTANDKTGDPLRTCFKKTNENFNELYDLTQSGNNTVYLRSEDDLPNKTASTWTMEANTPYKIAASFSTVLQAIPATGSSLSGDNVGSYTMSFTGSGSMFKGSDVDFFIHNMSVDPGILNTTFEFDETVGGLHRFICDTVQVLNCAVWGKFTDLRLTQVTNSSGENADNGLQFFGTNNLIWSITQLALISTSATFKGVDMGTATATIPEFRDLFMIAPTGALGMSGLVSSGNVPTGSLGSIVGCEFLGGMTDLENLNSNDDVRWDFKGNNPTSDTQPDALTSFSGNATETIISASSTDGSNAVLVAGTWVGVQSSLFSTTAAGRITYLAERAIKAPVDLSVGIISSSGGSITVKVYVVINGSVIVASGIDATISGSVAANLSIPWQITFEENNYIEIFVENQSNTTNIIVDHAVFRVL